MTTLFLACHDRRNRSWFPVGRLTRNDSEPVEYEFEYIRGAQAAKDSAVPLAIPVPGFPELDRAYRATEIFPIFRYRAMNQRRPDRPEYLKIFGLDPDDTDVLKELAISGGHSVADTFEIFPAIEPDADGRFKTRFIVQGLRPAIPETIERVISLNPGDRLELSRESNGPSVQHSIRVTTTDQKHLDWLLRHLVDVLRQSDALNFADIQLRVVQINHQAPLSHRLLVELTGQLPPGVDPMRELEQYQPISTPLFPARKGIEPAPRS